MIATIDEAKVKGDPKDSIADLTGQGRVVHRSGRKWFEISQLESLPPFMMILTSDRDHWMFINSDGSLTCGRRNPDHALLPYYTQDKLQDMKASSGSFSAVRRSGLGGLWLPFGDLALSAGSVNRVLRKSDLGDWIELEETHREWGLRWTIDYRSSGRLGFVRTVSCENLTGQSCSVEILDGLRNILCPGIESRFQNEFSCLGDAYKQAMYDGKARMGIYSLSSLPTDLASPMEALRANVVWAVGADAAEVTLSADAGDRFCQGLTFGWAHSLRGRSPAYLLHQELPLQPFETRTWHVCADVDQDLAQVEQLRGEIMSGDWDSHAVLESCERNAARLQDRLVQADGVQVTNHARGDLRHLSNTLFNLMRGGALPTGYEFPKEDLRRTLQAWNKAAVAEFDELFAGVDALDLFSSASSEEVSADLRRLLGEYLPLTFSRRHGDPSRPWNRFSIELEDAQGNSIFAYQGNWRDIFQNWEALLQSYPHYYPNAIQRFLNSSSADGYNPYRVNKEGFEWEEPNPEDPWANIGYWGDHQIIYLLRLLEPACRFLGEWWLPHLADACHVYADIPYRIVNFDRMLSNPRETIEFDTQRAEAIRGRVEEMGTDGKLLHCASGLVRVNLLEKLCVPMLAKMANYIPAGGIWMNTQRPEWNDANNALVGYGVSVVTAGYLLRYARFLETTFSKDLARGDFALTIPVALWLQQQADVLAKSATDFDDRSRLAFMRALSSMADEYRDSLYSGKMTGEKCTISGSTVLSWLRAVQRHLSATLQANRREDGLYHSYNLIRLRDDSVGIKHLQLMLEGQVSIISSGLLSGEQVLEIYHALRRSDLYRKDQHSYLLYPDKQLPGFLQKNRIPAALLADFGDWRLRADRGSTRLLRPVPGSDAYCFDASLRNTTDLLSRLAKEHAHDTSPAEQKQLIELYEAEFDHHAFTGRSGTFYAYEGLGSIYWHMVSKLALAILEEAVRAHDCEQSDAAHALLDAYRDIKDGLGVDKPVSVHGAVPTDAYSHTPGHAGAQQPGMTGQVKEDILSRSLEWGVSVRDGRIGFSCRFLDREQSLLSEATACHFLHVDGTREVISVPVSSCLFSCCQVPIVYSSAGAGCDAISIYFRDGRVEHLQGTLLPQTVTDQILRRSGRIRRIDVVFKEL